MKLRVVPPLWIVCVPLVSVGAEPHPPLASVSCAEAPFAVAPTAKAVATAAITARILALVRRRDRSAVRGCPSGSMVDSLLVCPVGAASGSGRNGRRAFRRPVEGPPVLHRFHSEEGRATGAVRA